GGEGDGHQVVQVAVVAAVAQVFAVERHPVLVEEAAHAPQEWFVQRPGAAERERQAVAGEHVPLGQLGEAPAQPAADADPVLGRHFQEVEGARRGVLQRAHQGPPQSHPGALRRECAWLHGVAGRRASDLAAALAFAALAFLGLVLAALAFAALAFLGLVLAALAFAALPFAAHAFAALASAALTIAAHATATLHFAGLTA